MKKIILKQFYNPIIFAFFTILNFGNLKAQTHNKAAANCIYHDDYLKTASKIKNAVSCVDCYCKICGDKKAKEKEAKKKAEEAANKQKVEEQKLEDQKKLAENKKKLEAENQKEKQKAKDNEAILVAPKPKVEKNMTVALSVEVISAVNAWLSTASNGASAFRCGSSRLLNIGNCHISSIDSNTCFARKSTMVCIC